METTISTSKSKLMKIVQNKKFLTTISVVSLLMISLIVILPFVCSNVFSGHDFDYHIESILSLNQAWVDGTFTSKIYALICADYGYGTGLFYSVIPAGTVVIFMNVLNLDVIGAIGLFYFLLFALSGLVVYGFANRLFKKNWIALLCGVFYVLFPYFLSNLYVRFAFSESVMMLNIPLIVWGVFELIEKRNYKLFIPLFTIGYSLAILTHITLTLYLTIFVVIYLIINIKKLLKSYNWVPFICSVFLVLLITTSFYLPMLINLGETQAYRLARDGLLMWRYSCQIFSDDFLISSTLIMLAIYIIFCFVHFKRKQEERKPLNKYFILFTIIIGVITPIFPWVLLGFKPFSMIQFPWRLFSIEGIILVILLGYLLKYLNKRLLKSLLVVSVNAVIIICFVCVGVQYTTNKYPSFERSGLNYSCTSTFYGLGGSKSGDYYPTNELDDYYDYVAYRINENAVIESNIDIKELAVYQSMNKLTFLISNSTSGYVTLNIPYGLTQNNSYLFNKVSYPNNSGNLFISSEIIEDREYLRLDFEDVDSEYLVTIDYSLNSSLKEYLQNYPFEFIVTEGNASFTNFVKTNVTTYSVDIVVDTNAKIELPTLFYKGYTLTYTDLNGDVENLVGVHNSNGFIEIELDKSGTLNVEFNPTYINVSNIISIVGAVLFAIVLLCILLIPRKFFTKIGDKITEFLRTHKTIAEILRFIIVGGIATLIDMFTMGVVMYFMQKSIYPSFINVFINSPTPSTFATITGTTIGFVTGLIVNYVLSILFVFNEKGNSKTFKGFVVFCVLSVIGLVINIIGTYIGFDLLHLNQWLVKIIMIVIVLIYNYISKKLILFKNKDSADSSKKE